MKPSPRLVAMLLVYSAYCRADDVGSWRGRVRVTPESLRRISGRGILRDEFLDQVIEELPTFGWIGFRAPAGHLAMTEDHLLKSWTVISTKHLFEAPEKAGPRRDIARKLKQNSAQ